MAGSTERTSRSDAAILLVTLILVGAVTAWSLAPPGPSSRAPQRAFSAERALTVLRDILQGGQPHPVGSVGHAGVRDRIINRFHQLGYVTTLQRTFACNGNAVCAPVENILAARPGEDRAGGVTLVAHYDSVPAGAGASDDGAGVASILEIARAVHGEQFRNPVRFLITDAEEAGLLGAEGFVADRAVFDPASVVINFENRGTSGPSFLFETSRGNAWLLRLVAGAMRRPAASSLFYSIYELLPNDTDLTVFKRAGNAGINLAAVGGVSFYHTPLDDIAHVSPSTLQHAGDSALAITRALATADLQTRSLGNAIYFDLFGRALLWWPERWIPWMEGGLTAALLAAAVLLIRRKRATVAGIAVGVVSLVLSLLLALALGALVSALMSLRRSGAIWVASPAPSVAAMWLSGILTSLLVAVPMRRLARFDDVVIGFAACWTALAYAAALFLSGATYLFLIPAALLTAAAILRAFGVMSEVAVAIGSSSAAMVLVLPFAILLYDALGTPVLPGIALILALIVAPAAAVVAAGPAGLRRWISTIAAAGIALSAGAALALPPYTSTHPQRISITYLFDADSRAASWITSALTPALERTGLASTTSSPFPWLPHQTVLFATSAPRMALPAAEATVRQDRRVDGHREISLHLHSMRAASRVALWMHSDAPLTAVRVNGIALAASDRRRLPLLPGWRRVVIWASDADVDFTTGAGSGVDLVVTDTTFGLPQTAAPIMRARDESPGVASNDGDATVVLRRLRI